MQTSHNNPIFLKDNSSMIKNTSEDPPGFLEPKFHQPLLYGQLFIDVGVLAFHQLWQQLVVVKDKRLLKNKIQQLFVSVRSAILVTSIHASSNIKQTI